MWQVCLGKPGVQQYIRSNGSPVVGTRKGIDALACDNEHLQTLLTVPRSRRGVFGMNKDRQQEKELGQTGQSFRQNYVLQ